MGSRRTTAFGLRARRGVFIDRDGVLTNALERDGKPFPPTTLAAVSFASGAREAVARLRDAGLVTICVTNQPDVARGTLARDVADQINRLVVDRLGLNDLIACFHDDADSCACRKPKPGMLVAGATRWELSLKTSYMIGDRWRDIDAGAAAGCKTILVDHGWAERASDHRADARVSSVREAATWITTDAKENVTQ